MKTFDYFFSYSHNNQDFVHAVLGKLISRGGTVWIDLEQIRPGDNLVSKINSGLAESLCRVIFYSASYDEKRWTQEEMNAAINDSIQNKSSLIVVVLDATPLPPLLAGRLYINASDRRKTPDDIAQELLKVKKYWFFPETTSLSDDKIAPQLSLETISIDDVTSITVEDIAKKMIETMKVKQNINPPENTGFSFDTWERGRGSIRCYIRSMAISKELLLDLESQLKICELNKKHVRFLNEEIATGGLGASESSYIIRVELKLKTLNDNIQEIRNLLGSLITKMTLVDQTDANT